MARNQAQDWLPGDPAHWPEGTGTKPMYAGSRMPPYAYEAAVDCGRLLGYAETREQAQALIHAHLQAHMCS